MTTCDVQKSFHLRMDKKQRSIFDFHDCGRKGNFSKSSQSRCTWLTLEPRCPPSSHPPIHPPQTLCIATVCFDIFYMYIHMCHTIPNIPSSCCFVDSAEFWCFTQDDLFTSIPPRETIQIMAQLRLELFPSPLWVDRGILHLTHLKFNF